MALVWVLTLGFGVEASAQQYEIFAGVLSDTNGAPLVGKVSINGLETQTFDDGYFEVLVPTSSTQTYRINARKLGYVPYSVVHVGLALEAMEIRLKRAEVFNVNPSQSINVVDSRGTQLSIPAGSMVNAAGQVATGPLTLSLSTYDLRNEQMVGDMTAVDSTGQRVALESVGAFSAEFTDAAGNLYNLAPGRQATVSMPLDPAINPASLSNVLTWWFDESRSIWVEKGVATVSAGRVSGQFPHFSLWNFDMKVSAPSCVKLTVDPTFFTNNQQSDGMFHMRATIRAPVYRSQLLRIDRPFSPVTNRTKHALYNLANNANVEFTVFVRNSAGVFEERPYAFVNSGAAWGGVGAPLTTQIDQCKGSLHVDGVFRVSQVQGRLQRQGRTSAHGGISVLVTGSAGTFTAVTDNNGNFSMLVATGTYTVTASRPNYLSLSKTGVSAVGGILTQLNLASLPAGDVDDDDVVEPSDASAIINAITNPPTNASSTDPRDINGNLIIDWSDAQIAVGNGGLTSPQPWP